MDTLSPEHFVFLPFFPFAQVFAGPLFPQNISGSSITHLVGKKCAKLWFHYVQKFLEQELSETYPQEETTILSTSLQLVTSGHVFKKYSQQVTENLNREPPKGHYENRTTLRADFNSFRTGDKLVNPLEILREAGEARLRVYSLGRNAKQPFSLVHVWYSTLFVKLRFNLTLHLIEYVFVHDVDNQCHFGKLNLKTFAFHQYELESRDYCGIHSEFSTFPRHHKLNLTSHVYPLVSYNLSLSLSVIDSRVMHTSHKDIMSWHTHSIPSEVHLFLFWHVSSLEFFIRKFNIIVNKYQTIRICLHSIGLGFKVYNGPGDKSQQLRPVSLIYKTSSFHGVVEDWFTLKNQNLFSFVSVAQTFTKYFNVTGSSTELYSTDICMNAQPVCGFHLKTSENFYLLTKIRKITYDGEGKSPQCYYAGLTIFDSLDFETKHEISTLCLPSDQSYKYKPVYSQSSVVLITVYFHAEYCNFTCSMFVSSTKCVALTINTCHQWNIAQTWSPTHRNALNFTLVPSRSPPEYHVEMHRNTCVVLQLTYSKMFAVKDKTGYFAEGVCGTDTFLRHSPIMQHNTEIHYKVEGMFVGKFDLQIISAFWC